MQRALLSASVLSSDFLNLGKTIEMLNENDAVSWLHLDVMDGRFVPNISFGVPVVEAICKASKKLNDVHLMIEEPGKYAEIFAKAGASQISVHIEACPNLHRNIQQIKACGVKAGVAVNPHTSVHQLSDIIADLDLVLLMSVNPGFGGQKFITQTLNKISELKELILKKNSAALIEIDGGVDATNCRQIADAGADVLVLGNAAFGKSDPSAAFNEINALL